MLLQYTSKPTDFTVVVHFKVIVSTLFENLKLNLGSLVYFLYFEQ